MVDCGDVVNRRLKLYPYSRERLSNKSQETVRTGRTSNIYVSN